MSNQHYRVDLNSIESYEEIRERKQALKAEIDGLGKEITASAREIVVTGAKATLTTVAVAIVTKGMAAYLKFKRKSKSSEVDLTDQSIGSHEKPAGDAAQDSRLQGILMYIDMLVKVIDSAKVLYAVIQRYREGSWEEE